MRATDPSEDPGPSGLDGSVLALRALGLGDALTGIPAMRGLRRGFPGRRLVLAAPPAVGGWLQRLGVVERVLPTAGLEPLRWPAGLPVRDLITVNLHGSGPLSHRLLGDLGPSEMIAFRNDEADHRTGPAWAPGEHEVDRWCRLVTEAGGCCDRDDLRLSPTRGRGRGGYVVIHPGAASGSRRWPAARWAELTRHLADAGREVVVTGGPAERGLGTVVTRAAPGTRDLSGALTLDGLTEVVAGAGLLVSGDTGVAHLATAFATPSVLLFGPTPPRHWGPAIDPHLHTVLWHGGLDGADREGDPHADVLDPALARITVDEVLAAVTTLLSGVLKAT